MCHKLVHVFSIFFLSLRNQFQNAIKLKTTRNNYNFVNNSSQTPINETQFDKKDQESPDIAVS